MPATAVERFNGRTEKIPEDRTSKPTISVLWEVFTAADETEAFTAVQDAAPLVLDAMVRISVDLTERVDATTFFFTVEYEGLSKDEEEEEEESGVAVFGFDTGGGTAHITQALSTPVKLPANAANFKDAIGYDGEHVQGVDITIPAFNFTADVTLAQEIVTSDFQRRLMDMTGTVNDDIFDLENGPVFQPGEVLFLGASGTLAPPDKDGDRFWNLSYRFAAIKNEDVTVGDLGTFINKAGWDYLDVQYGEVTAPVGQPPALFKVPIAARVERVYKRTDFDLLGLT